MRILTISEILCLVLFMGCQESRISQEFYQKYQNIPANEISARKTRLNAYLKEICTSLKTNERIACLQSRIIIVPFKKGDLFWAKAISKTIEITTVSLIEFSDGVQKFVLAHEMGHVLLDHYKSFSSDKKEIDADAFAVKIVGPKNALNFFKEAAGIEVKSGYIQTENDLLTRNDIILRIAAINQLSR